MSDSHQWNYFTLNECDKLSKYDIILQAVLGIESCKTKKEVCEILEDIWQLGKEEGVKKNE